MYGREESISENIELYGPDFQNQSAYLQQGAVANSDTHSISTGYEGESLPDLETENIQYFSQESFSASQWSTQIPFNSSHISNSSMADSGLSVADEISRLANGSLINNDRTLGSLSGQSGVPETFNHSTHPFGPASRDL